MQSITDILTTFVYVFDKLLTVPELVRTIVNRTCRADYSTVIVARLLLGWFNHHVDDYHLREIPLRSQWRNPEFAEWALTSRFQSWVKPVRQQLITIAMSVPIVINCRHHLWSAIDWEAAAQLFLIMYDVNQQYALDSFTWRMIPLFAGSRYLSDDFVNQFRWYINKRTSLNTGLGCLYIQLNGYYPRH